MKHACLLKPKHVLYLFMYLFIYLFIHLFICLFILFCSFMYILFVYLYISLCLYLFLYLYLLLIHILWKDLHVSSLVQVLSKTSEQETGWYFM